MASHMRENRSSYLKAKKGWLFKQKKQQVMVHGAGKAYEVLKITEH